MRKIIMAAFILAVFSINGFCQEENEYSRTLQKMFALSGSEASYQVAIEQMFEIFKGQFPNADSEVWAGLEREFRSRSMDELRILLVPVYQKYLTQNDLEEIIQFYESPVGQKFAKNTPSIMQESMQVGQQWGMKIGEEFQKKMQEKGF